MGFALSAAIEAPVRKSTIDRLLPEGTVLPPRNAEQGDEAGAWDDLDPADQALFARYMEVYAAMVDSVDQSVGRLYADQVRQIAGR